MSGGGKAMEPTLSVEESPKKDVQPGKKPYHRPSLRAAGRARDATQASFVPYHNFDGYTYNYWLDFTSGWP